MEVLKVLDWKKARSMGLGKRIVITEVGQTTTDASVIGIKGTIVVITKLGNLYGIEMDEHIGEQSPIRDSDLTLLKEEDIFRLRDCKPGRGFWAIKGDFRFIKE